MIFASDNWAGAHPAINERLMKESTRFAAAYGTSELDQAIEKKFNEIFEREVAVFFVGTGTAANSLALASVARPGGIAFCHSEAHVIEDECGAPIYFSNASRLMPVAGPNGKMLPKNLKAAIDRFPPGSIHQGQPMLVTMTQATEQGTIYDLDEISARSPKLPRALAFPCIWTAHVCQCADRARHHASRDDLEARRRYLLLRRNEERLLVRGSHRLYGSENGRRPALHPQALRPALLQDPLHGSPVRRLFPERPVAGACRPRQRHGNRLRDGLSASNSARLAWPTQSNELFVVLDKQAAKAARDAGASFYDWPVPHDMQQPVGENEQLIRLVTSFATEESDVDSFLRICGRA